jgi:hypothetical protein
VNRFTLPMSTPHSRVRVAEFNRRARDHGRWRRSRSVLNLGAGTASLLVGGAGPSCHPEVAGFGEAARHVPQLQVQMLR